VWELSERWSNIVKVALMRFSERKIKREVNEDFKDFALDGRMELP
jgi:hypothetical protein